MSKCFYRGVQIATNHIVSEPFELNSEIFQIQNLYFPEIQMSESIVLPQ